MSEQVNIKTGSLVRIHDRSGHPPQAKSRHDSKLAYVVRSPIDVGQPYQGEYAKCYKVRVVTSDGSAMPIAYIEPDWLEFIA